MTLLVILFMLFMVACSQDDITVFNSAVSNELIIDSETLLSLEKNGLVAHADTTPNRKPEPIFPNFDPGPTGEISYSWSGFYHFYGGTVYMKWDGGIGRSTFDTGDARIDDNEIEYDLDYMLMSTKVSCKRGVVEVEISQIEVGIDPIMGVNKIEPSNIPKITLKYKSKKPVLFHAGGAYIMVHNKYEIQVNLIHVNIMKPILDE